MPVSSGIRAYPDQDGTLVLSDDTSLDECEESGRWVASDQAVSLGDYE